MNKESVATLKKLLTKEPNKGASTKEKPWSNYLTYAWQVGLSPIRKQDTSIGNNAAEVGKYWEQRTSAARDRAFGEVTEVKLTTADILIIQCLEEFMSDKETWEGTAVELHSLLKVQSIWKKKLPSKTYTLSAKLSQLREIFAEKGLVITVNKKLYPNQFTLCKKERQAPIAEEPLLTPAVREKGEQAWCTELQSLRIEKGLTQAAVVKRIGHFSNYNASMIENRRKRASESVQLKWAAILGVTRDEIFEPLVGGRSYAKAIEGEKKHPPRRVSNGSRKRVMPEIETLPKPEPVSLPTPTKVGLPAVATSAKPENPSVILERFIEIAAWPEEDQTKLISLLELWRK